MTWFRLALKEWQRRPLRTVSAAGGVAIAVGALFSLLAFQSGYQAGVRRELDGLGAHVLLAPKGCPYDAASMALHGASWPCYLKERYVEEVRSVPGVAAAAPVFMTAVYDEQGQQNVYVGADTNLLALRPNWNVQGAFPQAQDTLLLGSEVARKTGWTIGRTVSLPGLHDQTGTVCGILAPTGGPDDTFIHLALTTAQRLFNHKNELTHILVRLADPNDLERTVSQLRGCDAGLLMNVVPLAHVFHTIQAVVNSTRLFLGCIAAIALLVAASGVSNAVAMAVVERRREIGMMRATGASRPDIFRLIWLETIQLSLAGALAGMLVALACARVVEAWARSRLPFAPGHALLNWQWWIAGLCLLCAVGLGSAAAFVPAWRAASVQPMTALRTGRRL